MIKSIHGILKRFSIGSSYDSDAQLFITAAGLTDTTQKNAVNQLVLDLKANGLWTKVLALWPFVGGTSTTHKYNLKDPQDLDSAFRLVFFGGVTHDANGVTGNGTNGYARTSVVPSTNLLLDSVSLFVYSRSNISAASVDMGSIKSGAPQHRLQINPRNASNNFTSACNDTTVSSLANTDSRGLFGISRISSSSYSQSNNSTQGTVSVTSTALNSVEIYLMAVNSNGPSNYSTRNLSLAWVGTGLTDAECDTLYTIVQTYQTSLSRNV